jgi:hypothetical protein
MLFAPLFLALASDLTPPHAGSFAEGPARPNAYVALNKGRMTLITDQGLENVSKLVGDAPLEHRGHLTVSALGEVELRWMSRGSLKVMGAASVEWSGSPFDGLPLGLFDFTRAEVEVRSGELGMRLPGGVLLVADRAALELVQRSSGVFGVHHLGGKPARLVIPAHGAPDVRTLETGAWIWIDPADYLGRSRFEYVLGQTAEADEAPANDAAPETEQAAEPQLPPNQATTTPELAPHEPEVSAPPVDQAPTVWVSTPIGMVEVEAPPVAPEPIEPIETPPAVAPEFLGTQPKLKGADAEPLAPTSTANPAEAVKSSVESTPGASDNNDQAGSVQPLGLPSPAPKWTPWMPELDWVPTPSALELQGLLKREVQAPTADQAVPTSPMPDTSALPANETSDDSLATQTPELALEAEPVVVQPVAPATTAIDSHLEQVTQQLSSRWFEDLSTRWQPSAPTLQQTISAFDWPIGFVSAPFWPDPIPLPNDALPLPKPAPKTKPALQPKT